VLRGKGCQFLGAIKIIAERQATWVKSLTCITTEKRGLGGLPNQSNGDLYSSACWLKETARNLQEKPSGMANGGT